MTAWLERTVLNKISYEKDSGRLSICEEAGAIRPMVPSVITFQSISYQYFSMIQICLELQYYEYFNKFISITETLKR